MNVNQMRTELEKKYNKQFTQKMKDDQVVAVYKRLQAKGQI